MASDAKLTPIKVVSGVLGTVIVCGLGVWLGAAAAGAAAAGGVVDASLLGRGPVGASFSASAVTAEFLKSVGGNFLAALGMAGWGRTCRRLAPGETRLASPLQAALRRAAAAAQDVEESWHRSDAARQLKARQPELFRAAGFAFRGLREASTGFPSADVLDPTAAGGELRFLLDEGPAAARDHLETRLRDYLGLSKAEDPAGVADFIARLLPGAFAVHFGEELERDSQAAGEAWVAPGSPRPRHARCPPGSRYAPVGRQ